MVRSMVVFVRLLLPLAVVIGGPVVVVGTRGSGPVALVEQVAGLWHRAFALADARSYSPHREHRGEPTEAHLPSRANIVTAAMSQRVSLAAAESIVPATRELDDRAKRRVADARRRLEELGAQYVLLESIEAIDGETPRFRFHCLMPLPGSVFSRPFDSVDADPAQAIEHVLLDVIEWQQAWPQTADDGSVPEPPSA